MEDEELLGIGDYLAVLKRRKYQLIVPALIVLLISTAIALGLPSIYRSEATILIEQQEVPSDLVRSTVTSYAGERIQMISSRVMTTDNLGKIIRDYGLYKKEQKNTSISLLVKRLRDEISLEMISADVLDPRSGRASTATIAFKLVFNDKNARVTQKVTNELVNLYLNENLKRRAQSALATSSFLGAEAEKLSQQIAALEAKLASFKEKNFNNLPELQQLNLTVMERNERELTNAKQQIQALQEKKIYLESELAQVSPKSDMYNSTGNRVMGSEDKLMALETEYVALATRYTDNHPRLIKMKGEIEALKAELGKKANNLKKRRPDNPAYLQLQTQLKSVNSELASMQEKSQQYQDKILEIEKRLVEGPQVEREYRNLSRDYDNAQAKYREIKAKELEAELAESLEHENKGERFSLIEPPQVPEKPFKPNRLAIFFLGFVFSLAVGFGHVIVREGIDQTVYGSKGIQSITKAPPLAVIPFIECSEDHILRRKIRMISITSVVAVAVFLVLFVHFFYMPLDVIWYVVLRKLGVDVG
ncbi:MAG: lipopolysaccharide biosynthesis protein [Candidatus Thiodiazotropha sp.]|jgi:polysaccharide biosynthesis transport protein